MIERDTGAKARSRLRLRVTSAAEAAIRSGHPWLFAEKIREPNREGQLGELAVIFDRKDRFLAIGLFDPESPIRVRILHAGEPDPIDRAWWDRRLAATLGARHGLFDAKTTGYRCINGESDGWPGLVLDRYAQTLVLKLYTAAWLPWLDEILELIHQQCPNERVVLRLSRNIQEIARRKFQRADGQIISGAPLNGTVVFEESGIKFEADVLRGQKTGFFLDQRENRRRVESLAQGRDVLNAFSFSGGFSLYAARGGARTVTDLDISSHALESARRNFALNRSDARVAACRHDVVQADAFKWLQEHSSRRLDMIVLDPPSLAKRAADKAAALQAYGKLTGNAIEQLRPGGILVAASCSAHVPAAEFFQTVRSAVARSRKRFRELGMTGHAPDHPATFREGEYLKCIYLRQEP